MWILNDDRSLTSQSKKIYPQNTHTILFLLKYILPSATPPSATPLGSSDNSLQVVELLWLPSEATSRRKKSYKLLSKIFLQRAYNNNSYPSLCYPSLCYPSLSATPLSLCYPLSLLPLSLCYPSLSLLPLSLSATPLSLCYPSLSLSLLPLSLSLCYPSLSLLPLSLSATPLSATLSPLPLFLLPLPLLATPPSATPLSATPLYAISSLLPLSPLPLIYILRPSTSMSSPTLTYLVQFSLEVHVILCSTRCPGFNALSTGCPWPSAETTVGASHVMAIRSQAIFLKSLQWNSIRGELWCSASLSVETPRSCVTRVSYWLKKKTWTIRIVFWTIVL